MLDSTGLNHMSKQAVEAALAVHTALGPGLLESVYAACLAQELRKRALPVETQVALPVIYDGLKLEAGYRIDILVAEQLIIEVKAVEGVHPIHKAQLLSYLKLSGKRLGLLFNFNVIHMRDGITRMVNGF